MGDKIEKFTFNSFQKVLLSKLGVSESDAKSAEERLFIQTSRPDQQEEMTRRLLP